MTNSQTESLLSRFADVSQRLKGTGAPGVPEWCAPETHTTMRNGTETVWRFDDEVRIAGFVMWAMEVAEWAYLERKVKPCTVMVKHTPETWADETESIADAIGGG